MSLVVQFIPVAYIDFILHFFNFIFMVAIHAASMELHFCSWKFYF